MVESKLRNSPRLKKTGERSITVYGLNPPHSSKGIIHALKTNSSVRGACELNRSKFVSDKHFFIIFTQ